MECSGLVCSQLVFWRRGGGGRQIDLRALALAIQNAEVDMFQLWPANLVEKSAGHLSQSVSEDAGHDLRDCSQSPVTRRPLSSRAGVEVSRRCLCLLFAFLCPVWGQGDLGKGIHQQVEAVSTM